MILFMVKHRLALFAHMSVIQICNPRKEIDTVAHQCKYEWYGGVRRFDSVEAISVMHNALPQTIKDFLQLCTFRPIHTKHIVV